MAGCIVGVCVHTHCNDWQLCISPFLSKALLPLCTLLASTDCSCVRSLHLVEQMLQCQCEHAPLYLVHTRNHTFKLHSMTVMWGLVRKSGHCLPKAFQASPHSPPELHPKVDFIEHDEFFLTVRERVSSSSRNTSENKIYFPAALQACVEQSTMRIAAEQIPSLLWLRLTCKSVSLMWVEIAHVAMPTHVNNQYILYIHQPLSFKSINWYSARNIYSL